MFALLGLLRAQESSPSARLHGVVQTAAGSPAAGAAILLHNIEKNADQTALAGPDGTFTISNLTPGHYQLTASQRGFANSSVIAVQLASGQALELSLTLGPP